MDLYFFRHGDAEPAAAGQPDEERRLTERGKRETLAAAQALRHAGLRPEAIVTSPLLRARETGEILQGAFGVRATADDRLRSGCRMAAIQGMLSNRPHQSILLVGHEPDFSTIVGRLIGDARVQMKKSGCARVQAQRIEPEQGTLVWLLTPDLFAIP